MSASGLALIKAAIALVACLVLARQVLTRRSDAASRWLLLLCAACAIAAYLPLKSLARGNFVHRWEMFHYYVGAKYHRELGYDGLYACVAAADVAAKVPFASVRRVRDLNTDGLVPANVAIEQASCGKRFSPERWQAFRSDVAAFRKLAGTRKHWESMQQDHGYNPPPLWTLSGRFLASLAPPSHGYLTLLACIDLTLLAGAVALLVWGFGAHVGVLAVIFWGTQAASEFGWTGGGFLRQDWLFFSVLALSLLRRGRPFWAGTALACAALLRLFPVLLACGLLVSIAAATLRRRRLSEAHARVLAGGAVAAIALVAASSAALGVSDYASFWEHIQLRHTSAISNHMSLRTLFAFSNDARLVDLIEPRLLDPAVPWSEARQARLADLAFWYRASAWLLVASVVFVTYRVRTTWIAVALSLPLIPALTDPSCYYYSVWVLAFVLVKARSAIGVPLLGVAAAGQTLLIRFHGYDERFAALALLYVVSALTLLLAFSDGPITRFRRFWERKSAPRAAARSENFTKVEGMGS